MMRLDIVLVLCPLWYLFLDNVSGLKPNILFLNVDEMDGRNMDPTSPEQYTPISMPNLRDMATKGVQFVRHYSNGPQCVCGRSVMWSGRRTNDIHVYNNNMGFAASSNGTLDRDCVTHYNESKCQRTAMLQNLNYTILDAMQSLGYNVYIYGKLHIGAGIMQMSSQSNASCPAFASATSANSLASITRSANIFKPSQGNPMNGYNDNSQNPHAADEHIANSCIQRLNELGSTAQTEPFLLYCSLNIPHPGYETNATWLKGVDVSTIIIPSNLNDTAYNAFDAYTSQSMNCYNQTWTDKQVIDFRKTYYGLNVQTDYLLGTVMDALFLNGFNLSNTYIVFTSDHGEDNLDHRQYGKNSMYEGATRVPLFIVGPNIKSRAMVTNVTESVDILPTLISLGGGATSDIPRWLSGTTLMPFLSDDGDIHNQVGQHPEYITSQYHSLKANTGSFMVRKGKWKYIEYGHSLKAFTDYKAQLFDLELDPQEMYDVSKWNGDIMREMENILLTQYDYEYADCVAKKTDLDIFNEFVWNKYSQSQVYKYLQNTYHGFDTADWEKIVNWRNELMNVQCVTD
eukprot:550644_1